VRVQIASEPGSPDRPNEDYAAADRNVVVIVDGLTARTDTGCIHGVSWFAKKLANAVLNFGHLRPVEALKSAIQHTATMHSDTCDLTNPATPCAAVAIVQVEGAHVHYLVLGDVTVVIANGDERVISDQRINSTALDHRAEADRLPTGSEAKSAALVRMKQAEIAARNSPGGYWIAGADPVSAEHALTGDIAWSQSGRIALLTDGAARAVDLFAIFDWPEVLEILSDSGPRDLIARVRDVEHADATASRWPRNKISDDATAVYCDQLRVTGSASYSKIGTQ
jgi:hypothetical protein